jgi:hypothetical protein
MMVNIGKLSNLAKPPRPPDELWRCIFEECAKVDGQIITLIRICRRWRDVAYAIQRLWRRILLSGDAIYKSLRQGSVHASGGMRYKQTLSPNSESMTSLEGLFKRQSNSLLHPASIIQYPPDPTAPPEARYSIFGHTTPWDAPHRFTPVAITRHARNQLLIDLTEDIDRLDMRAVADGGFATVYVAQHRKERVSNMLFIRPI